MADASSSKSRAKMNGALHDDDVSLSRIQPNMCENRLIQALTSSASDDDLDTGSDVEHLQDSGRADLCDRTPIHVAGESEVSVTERHDLEPALKRPSAPAAPICRRASPSKAAPTPLRCASAAISGSFNSPRMAPSADVSTKAARRPVVSEVPAGTWVVLDIGDYDRTRCINRHRRFDRLRRRHHPAIEIRLGGDERVEQNHRRRGRQCVDRWRSRPPRGRDHECRPP